MPGPTGPESGLAAGAREERADKHGEDKDDRAGDDEVADRRDLAHRAAELIAFAEVED